MTKFTRSVQWNSGVMLGWNSSRRMDGILRHLKKETLQNNDANLCPDMKMATDKQNLVSSFFPNGGSTNEAGESSLRSSPRQNNARRHYFEPQKDVSPEFLKYLRNMTKRDFEHAVEDDHLNNNVMQSMIVDSYVNNATAVIDISNKSKVTPSSQKKSEGNATAVHGYHLFATPTNTSNARPSTVPRYVTSKHKSDQNSKNFRRPGTPLPTDLTDTETYNSKVRALTKTKLTSNDINNNNNLISDGNSIESPINYDVDGEQPTTEEISYASSYCATPCDSQSERPSSSTSSTGGSKRVTFAADVVNYERENKPPKKRKMPRRRRQGFPHPSRGIFVPPDVEIVESSGPTGICRDNPYLNFNQVWTHPAARSTGESQASRVVRQERFHRIMNDLEHSHIQYNRLISYEQNDYLIHSIFKRYILVLDLALMEGHLTQVEHLLETISKSIPVLQQNTFYYLYGPKIIKDIDQNQDKKDEEHPDLVLTRYALSRISGPLPRQDTTSMSIETVLVKLCLELIELVFSHYGTLEFRNALSVVPYTARQAITLLKELRISKDSFCYIKWINNSAVQRDYRSIMKNLGLLDRYGCKAEILTPGSSVASSKVAGAESKKIKRASRYVLGKRIKIPPKPIPEMMQAKPIPRSTSS